MKKVLIFLVTAFLLLFVGCDPVDDEVTCTVTFNSLGGSEVPGQSVVRGALVEKPGDPVKAGFSFSGWYSEESCINPWKFDDHGVMRSMILYAKWIDLNAVERRELVSITGGTFTQEDTDGHSFNHTISTFSLGKYEVTYELWYTVYHWAINNGYTFANPGQEGHDGTPGGVPTDAGHEPVTNINWRDAIIWCNAYSQLNGYTPCYTYDGEVIKDSLDIPGTNDNDVCDNAVCDWAANGYRLPSEGEWQFAASNRGSTPYNYASGAAAPVTDAAETGKVAWFSINSGMATHDVGTTENSSALTLWDLSGNVLEWTWDWLVDYPGDSTDYRGPSTGFYRNLRGGAYVSGENYQPLGFRFGISSDYELNFFGFRIAMSE